MKGKLFSGVVFVWCVVSWVMAVPDLVVLSENYRLRGGVNVKILDTVIEDEEGNYIPVYHEFYESYDEYYAEGPVSRFVKDNWPGNWSGATARSAAGCFYLDACSFSAGSFLDEIADSWAESFGSWLFEIQLPIVIQFKFEGYTEYTRNFDIRLFDTITSQEIFSFYSDFEGERNWESHALLLQSSHQYLLSMRVDAYPNWDDISGGFLEMRILQVVPEPATLVLLSAGLAFCGLARHR